MTRRVRRSERSCNGPPTNSPIIDLSSGGAEILFKVANHPSDATMDSLPSPSCVPRPVPELLMWGFDVSVMGVRRGRYDTGSMYSIGMIHPPLVTACVLVRGPRSAVFSYLRDVLQLADASLFFGAPHDIRTQSINACARSFAFVQDFSDSDGRTFPKA